MIVLALWALFFLGALALAVGSHVAANIRVAAATRRRAVSLCLARAAVERAAMEFTWNTNRWDGLTASAWNCDPSVFRLNRSLPGGAFSITYEVVGEGGRRQERYGLMGEEARVNINKAGETLLAAVWESIGGMDARRAGDLAKAVVAWREPAVQRLLTDDPETQYYANLDRPYACHRGPFQALPELLLVRGMTVPVWRRVAPYLTVHGSGRVNVNLADSAVLECLARSRGVPADAVGELVSDVVAVRPLEKVLDFEEQLSDKAKRYFGAIRNLLTVRSTCYSGVAAAVLAPDSRQGRGGASPTGGADSRVAFVVDENGVKLHWHEY